MYINKKVFRISIVLMLLTVFLCCKKDPVVENPPEEPDDGSISGTLTRDTVFSDIIADPNVGDYYISGVLNIEAVLKIDSGVVIEMGPNASIVIKNTGTIIARGEATHPIIITGRSKSRGSWKYIMINSNDPRNEISNCQIEYGGGDDSNNGTVYLNSGGYLSLFNSKISNSKNNAIVVAAADANLNNFNNNQIENNEYPIQIRPNQIPQINSTNSFANNDYGIITLIGSYIERPLLWEKKDLPFVHKGTTVIKAEVQITEGVQVTMDLGSLIDVRPEGSLNATGTASQRIYFNSADTIQGYWNGIFYQSRSNNNRLSYVNISFGGGHPSNMGSIYIGTSLSFPEAYLTMNNCSVSKSASWGIYVQNNAELVNGGGNIFSNNIMGDIGP